MYFYYLILVLMGCVADGNAATLGEGCEGGWPVAGGGGRSAAASRGPLLFPQPLVPSAVPPDLACLR